MNAFPQPQPKFTGSTICTIDENYDDNMYFGRSRDHGLNKVTSRDTVGSETTLVEPMHNKNDSYNSINSIDTISSFKLKRYNSASSLPMVNTHIDPSYASPKASPAPLALSPTTSTTSVFKKVVKHPLPQNVDLITNTELSLMMMMDTCLVIDVRPFIEFSAGHVKGAINFNLPSTLLKRQAFTLQKCMNNVSLVENMKLSNFLKMQSPDKKVVFYDDSEVFNGEVPLTLFGSVNKFINDESFIGELYIIKSGFPGFKKDFPDLVEVNTQSQQAPTRPPPHNRSLSLASLSTASSPISPNLSRFQLPKLPKTPVFKIRHNEECYDFENYKLMNDFKHLNYAFNHGPSSKLPEWFNDLFKKGNTHSLIEKFKNLEIEEKRRINCMISTNSVGSGIELGFKNRYKDIFPYEHSRVKLALTPTQESNGYINANFVNAPQLSNMKYIATQAPLQDTAKDFAKLCNDNNVSVVVVLTSQFENGVEKCYPYWDDSINFELVETVKLDEIILRRLKLKNHGESEVLQIQILNWSDCDVMVNRQQDDVLKMIYLKNYVLQALGKLEDNVIVHCSAGCGRTGTFCTLDSIINKAFVDEELRQKAAKSTTSQFDPIFEVVESFRHQRISMVQNLRQYLFIYDCLLNYYENFNGFEADCFEKLRTLDIVNHYIGERKVSC